MSVGCWPTTVARCPGIGCCAPTAPAPSTCDPPSCGCWPPRGCRSGASGWTWPRHVGSRFCQSGVMVWGRGPQNPVHAVVPAGAQPGAGRRRRRCWTPTSSQVVQHDRGVLRVLAGPGTGKTTTLVEAVAPPGARARHPGRPAPAADLLPTGRRPAARPGDRPVAAHHQRADRPDLPLLCLRPGPAGGGAGRRRAAPAAVRLRAGRDAARAAGRPAGRRHRRVAGGAVGRGADPGLRRRAAGPADARHRTRRLAGPAGRAGPPARPAGLGGRRRHPAGVLRRHLAAGARAPSTPPS